MHEPPPLPTTRLSIVLATVPVLALTAGIPFANRLEPRIFGLPFLLAYIVAWILLTPAFLTTVYALDRAAARRRK
jgi:DMSO/TMAO reductase YedYZ heme-binding membrane subunit